MKGGYDAGQASTSLIGAILALPRSSQASSSACAFVKGPADHRTVKLQVPTWQRGKNLAASDDRDRLIILQ